jgi:hypothetical protein
MQSSILLLLYDSGKTHAFSLTEKLTRFAGISRGIPSVLPAQTATGFDEARQLLYSPNDDVAVLDIIGVRGFELLEIAHHRGFPVVMLTAHTNTRSKR